MINVKIISIKLNAWIIPTGLYSAEIVQGDNHFSAREYYRRICPNFIGCRYLGDGRFQLTYEV